MPKATTSRIRVLLVEEHPGTRQGLRRLLQANGGFEVVGESGDGEHAAAMARELLPDVAVVDAGVSKPRGAEVIRGIKSASPFVTILALTVEDDGSGVEAMLKAGASGYLLKTVCGDALAHSINALLAGECVLDQQIMQKLMRQNAARRRPKHPIPGVTPRDIRILLMIAEGLTNEDIAQRLSVSVRTAKLYISAIFGKLQTSSRTAAVVRALRDGVIRFEDLST